MKTPRDQAAAKMIELLDSPFLRALSEPARLEVVRVLLVHGPGDIGAIAEHLPQDRSVISRHLKLLEEAGIVRGVRDGRHRVYALDGARFVTTLETILGETKALAPLCCAPFEAPVDVPRDRPRRR